MEGFEGHDQEWRGAVTGNTIRHLEGDGHILSDTTDAGGVWVWENGDTSRPVGSHRKNGDGEKTRPRCPSGRRKEDPGVRGSMCVGATG